MLVSIAQAAWVIFLCMLAGTSVGYFVCRPRVWKEAPTDVLILVAHQDDCVVLAGEYALWALTAGKSVRVVYLTCGADIPGSPKAVMRNKEAIAVWRSAGVTESHLHFLDYGRSPLSGTSVLSDPGRLEATARIARLVREANPGTAVFLPAAGESHADHREIRRIGLRALNESGRRDLVVLEAPEYNPYLSFVRSPPKAFQYLVKSVPLVRRFARYFHRSGFPGFVHGSHAYRLLDAGEIHQEKLKMLRGFVSEGGELLVRHFGWRNQFRPVRWQDSSIDENLDIYYARVSERWLGLSVIGLWFSIYFLGTCISWRIAQGFEGSLPGKLGVFLIIACACGCFLAAIRGRRYIESCLLYVAVGLGMVIELCLVLIEQGL